MHSNLLALLALLPLSAAPAIPESESARPAPELRPGPAPASSRFPTLLGLAHNRVVVRLDDLQHPAQRAPEVVTLDAATGAVVSSLSIPELEAAFRRNAAPGEAYGGSTPTLRPASRPQFQTELRSYVDLLLGVGRREPRLAVSPDGKRLLFNASDWMYLSLDGGKTFRLLPSAASYGPVIAPDGKRGAFRSLDPRSGGRYSVYLQDLASGAKARRVEGTADAGEKLLFSPDSRFLYATASAPRPSGDKDGCLVQIDVAKGIAKRLGCVPIRSYSMGPAFALEPDGSRAVLLGEQGRHPEYVTPWTAFALPSGEAHPGKPLLVQAPLFPLLVGGRCAWPAIGSSTIPVLDLGSGRLSNVPGDARVVGLTDDGRLVAVRTSGTGVHAVRHALPAD